MLSTVIEISTICRYGQRAESVAWQLGPNEIALELGVPGLFGGKVGSAIAKRV